MIRTSCNSKLVVCKQEYGGIMNHKSVYKKKFVSSCMAVCLAGTVAWSAMSIPVWAAPASGTAKDNNTVVRDAIKGAPVGSLNANQEVKVKSEQKADDGYTWYQITFSWNGTQTEGWVRSDLITAADRTQDDSTADQVSDNTGTKAASDTTEKTDAQKKDEFSIDGKKYKIAETFPETEIPEGFQAAEITYGEQKVAAAQLETNEDIVLIYLQNTEDGTDKGIYLLDRARDEVVPFVSIASNDSFVVVTNVPEDMEKTVAGCYHHTLCNFVDGSMMAYQLTQEDDYVSEDVTATDFYYVYGTSGDGESGWYVYDFAENTIQRSIVNMKYDTTQTDTGSSLEDVEDTSVFETDSMTRMLIAGAGLIALLLLILLIVVSTRYRRLRRYLDGEFGIEDEDEDVDASDAEEILPSHTIEVALKNETVDIMDFDDIVESPVQKQKEKSAPEIKVPQPEKKKEPVPEEKEANPETEKLVADLKKLIQEVEVTKKAEADQKEEFFDEEDGEFYDEEDPAEKKEENDSWDDIEFL